MDEIGKTISGIVVLFTLFVLKNSCFPSNDTEVKKST